MDKIGAFTLGHTNANDTNDAKDGSSVDDPMGVNDINGTDEGNEDNHVARQYDLLGIPVLSAEQADAQVLGISESTAHILLLPSSDAQRRQLVLKLLQNFKDLWLVPLNVEEVGCSVLRLAAVSPTRSSLPRMQ
jgi:hypothetical protein